MKKELTKDFILLNRGCYSYDSVSKFLTKENYTLSELLALDFPLKDKFWFVCKKLATKEENQQIAISVAEIVLPLYEAKYPEDTRVRECIEAAKKYIARHISLDELLQARKNAANAIYAAYSAADYTAYAAYSAADYTAYAAYSAYASDAASDAYAAADYAAADYAEIKEKLLQVLLNYC